MCEKQPLPAEPVVRMTAPPVLPVPSLSKEAPPAPRLLPGGFVALPKAGEPFHWPTVAGN